MIRVWQWLAARLPHRRIVGEGGEPYLDRYFLFSLGPRHDPRIVAYLHRFTASDPDRGLHDHPWPWAWSWLVAGSYTEEFRSGGEVVERARTAGSLAVFGAGHAHRVRLPPETEAWTLFVHGPWRRPWGFWRHCGPMSMYGTVGDHWFFEEHSRCASIGWWRTAPRDINTTHPTEN
jgi:hypothetical protein